MELLKNAILWFSGGEVQYMPSVHCMNYDWLWINITIALSGSIFFGYFIISQRWSRNERLVSDSESKQALRTLRHIFFWCGVCGYGFNIVRMYWPAWRLLDVAQVWLTIVTFRYILATRGIKAVYEKLDTVKKLEQDIARLEQEAHNRRTFFNALNHDLRSPLNAVSLNCDMVRISIETNDAHTALAGIATVKENSTAANELLDRLLEYARCSSGEENVITVCSVNEIILASIRRFDSAAHGKGIGLKFPQRSDLEVRIDKVKFERIINNLIENAIKFTREGSVTINYVSRSRDLYVYVTDTGVGVPDDKIKHLFGEFYQVNNYERDRKKGFGMGLAISRLLAKQMGGDVQLERTGLGGSTFAIKLRDAIVEETYSRN